MPKIYDEATENLRISASQLRLRLNYFDDIIILKWFV